MTNHCQSSTDLPVSKRLNWWAWWMFSIDSVSTPVSVTRVLFGMQLVCLLPEWTKTTCQGESHKRGQTLVCYVYFAVLNFTRAHRIVPNLHVQINDIPVRTTKPALPKNIGANADEGRTLTTSWTQLSSESRRNGNHPNSRTPFFLHQTKLFFHLTSHHRCYNNTIQYHTFMIIRLAIKGPLNSQQYLFL